MVELEDTPALGAGGESHGGSSPSARIEPGQPLQAARRRFTLPRQMADTVIVHPNRDKPESKATKAAVILLLLTSAALIAIVIIGGFEVLQGAQPVAVGYVIVYLVFAFFVARWNRGVLPVAAGLAILFAVVAAVAAPAWFDRDEPNHVVPLLDPAILGLLTLIIVPVQVLLIAFAMRGFQQAWNVEIEVSREEAERGRPRDFEGGQPRTA